MKIPKYDDLVKDPEIGQIDLEEVSYFNVQDIRKKYDSVKFNTENIVEFLENKYICYTDIHPLTDFDKKIRIAMRFNPKK